LGQQTAIEIQYDQTDGPYGKMVINMRDPNEGGKTIVSVDGVK